MKQLFIVTANQRMVSIFASKYIEILLKHNLNKSNIKVIQSLDDCRGRSFERAIVILLEDFYMLKDINLIMEFFEVRDIETNKIHTQNKEFEFLDSVLHSDFYRSPNTTDKN